MRKLLAVVLALVLAFSCTAIAFAADTVANDSWSCPYCNQKFEGYKNDPTSQKLHMDACDKNPSNKTADNDEIYTCPGCGKKYTNLADYNACLASHNYGVDMHYDDYIGKTLPQLFETLMTYFVGSQSQTLIFDILYKIFDYITAFIDARIGGGTGDVEGVNGAVAELDSALAGIDLSLPEFDGVTDIVTSIKQEIKRIYASDIETSVEETEAEALPDTGSADAGIAVFAAVSVLAAVAFICTKKKAE